jgi:hypothetical protein
MVAGSRRASLRACSTGVFLLIAAAAAAGRADVEFVDPSIQAGDGSADAADASTDVSRGDATGGTGGTNDSGARDVSADSAGRAGTGGAAGSTLDGGRTDAARTDARLDGAGGARVDGSINRDAAGQTGGADDDGGLTGTGGDIGVGGEGGDFGVGGSFGGDNPGTSTGGSAGPGFAGERPTGAGPARAAGDLQGGCLCRMSSRHNLAGQWPILLTAALAASIRARRRGPRRQTKPPTRRGGATA